MLHSKMMSVYCKNRTEQVKHCGVKYNEFRVNHKGTHANN